MAVNKLEIGYTSGNSLNVDAISLSGYTDSVVLVADTAQDFTVPATAKFIFFNSTGNFYMKEGTGAASVPAASTSDGSASALNPQGRMVKGGEVLSLISSAGCTVTISCYN